MTYTPFLIANFATGFDQELQPWLLPNDAFTDLLDGFVYRGVTNKRDGYSGFANGLKSTYTESRMVHGVTAEAFGTGNGSAGPYTYTLANLPVSRGSVTITAGAQSATDTGTVQANGDGTFVTTPAGGTGSINYTTGVVSITFNGAVAGATPITVTYSYHQGLPVMGVMNFYPNTNTRDDNARQLIVVDEVYVNMYDPTTDRLVDISSATAYTGGPQDFFSWVNYADPNSVARLLFANGTVGDVIQQYDGSTVTAYTAVFTIAAAPATLNARQIFNVRDRLVLFQTYENGVFFPRRIRISGTGIYSDTFDQTSGGNFVAGAGFIDIPDNTFYFGAASNRDDIMFFTEAATWMLKYTGNDVTPFTLEKVDGSRGSKAAFSVISYLNRTLAASPRGLIISDGYAVERMDNNIPDFSFNSINNAFFESCFSGFVDEDRDVYLLYPSIGNVRPILVDPISSDRILTINFEEDNFAVYRIPLSSMGNFEVSKTILWSDLTAANGFPNWDALAAKYGRWDAFPFSTGTPVAIGGGHKGEIWRLNDTESEDNPQQIRNMVVVDATTLQITTDWNNYEVGDNIIILAVSGMTQANNQQGAIFSTPTPYNTFNIRINTNGFSSYTGGGLAAKVTPFEATSKKLNPWIDQDKKVLCGWMYFYVDVAETMLFDVTGAPIPAFLTVKVLTNNNEGTDFTNPTFTYLVDCSPINNEKGGKKWVKIWINQVGQFLQFQMSNEQAGAEIRVHAIIPGFRPIGRLI
jgi:hypothetical protein